MESRCDCCEYNKLITSLSCGHRLCLYCHIEVHSQRGRDVFKCPCCSNKVDRFNWSRPSGRTTRQKEHRFEAREEVVVQEELDGTIDKFRLFLQQLSALSFQEKQDMIGNGLLFNTLHMIKPLLDINNTVVDVVECSFSIDANGERIPNEKCRFSLGIYLVDCCDCSFSVHYSIS